MKVGGGHPTGEIQTEDGKRSWCESIDGQVGLGRDSSQESADYFVAAGGVAAAGVPAAGVEAGGVAAVGDEGFCWAARSFSTAALQRALKLALCLSMHASVFEILGADELQSRQASAAHFARLSPVQAKLCVERAEKEAAKAAMSKA